MLSPCVIYTRVKEDNGEITIIENSNNRKIYQYNPLEKSGIDKFAILGGITHYFGGDNIIINCETGKVFQHVSRFKWYNILDISPDGRFIIIIGQDFGHSMQRLYEIRDATITNISLYDECIQYDRDMEEWLHTNNIDLEDDNICDVRFDTNNSIIIRKIIYGVRNNTQYEYITRGIIRK